MARCFDEEPSTFLIASRIDVGFRASKSKVRAFAADHGYRYFETSAQVGGESCHQLREEIIETISWGTLTQTTTENTYKNLKDVIVELRDEGEFIVMDFKHLQTELQRRGAVDKGFTTRELETVVGLLSGAGVVKQLDFGAWILLKPEWINA